MKTRYLMIGIALFVTVAAVGLGWRQSNAQKASGATPLEATGVIEARRLSIAPEIGGKVIEVLIEEGQRVKAGQPLVRLDDSLLLAQRAQAQATFEAAQANYDLLAAGPTAEQLRQAQAELDAAQANYDLLAAGPTAEQLRQAEAVVVAATASYSRTIAGTRPASIAAARSALAAAAEAYNKVEAGPQPEDYAAVEAAYRNAQVALQQAQWAYDASNRRDPAGINASPAAMALQQATNNYNAAKAAYDKVAKGPDAAQVSAAYQQVQGARAVLDQAVSPARDFDIVQAKSQVDQAQAALDALRAGARAQQLDAAKARVDAAEAALGALKAGARPQQFDAAKAQVAAARAAVDALNVEWNKLTITAPWDGIVLNRSAEPGLVASPGATLLEIGQLGSLKLTVYLPEDRFGLVTPDQAAQVRVDAYPERTFTGTVLRLADEAEFTPTNVQTKEDRSRLVYAVTISLDNPDLALKPGMIADVEFRP